MTTPIDILLVDDERRNLDALEAILSDPAYRLLRAEDGDSALRLLLENDVAAIVLDVQMPGVSGFELAQMIKRTKRFRETPIMFLSAYLLDDQHVVQGYGSGAVDYLTKPFNPQILRQKIAVFAELFRKTRALAELNEQLETRVRERTAELETSEAALRAASAQKDEFLAVLAHELRNPLAPLRTGLAILTLQPSQTPAVSRTLAAMNRQLDHMVRLIDDLLDISRVSRGLLELKKEPLDLRELVEATVETFRPTFEKRRQSLSAVVIDPVGADADATRIAQVLGNLLHNATKFTPEGGDVTVELRREADEAVVRVIDSGIGIPVGQLDKAFGMFARIDRQESLAQPGLGIGLALARKLAQMHGGTLDGSSAGEGCGSTFTLRIPATRLDEPDVDSESVPELDGGAIRRVLVIEDNVDVADTLIDWLQQSGHTAWLARDGRSGVELAAEVRPDIVLCDLGLPGMDGIEVCRLIRELPITNQPLMVALTGWGRDGDRTRTKDAGFDHHLVKPVAADKLDALLRDVGSP